jgi:hypothetical protein
MKITSSLKAQLITFATAYLFGQLRDLEALADALQSLATEARTQAESQKQY